MIVELNSYMYIVKLAPIHMHIIIIYLCTVKYALYFIFKHIYYMVSTTRTHIHRVTYVVILRSVNDTAYNSTFCDVCMAPVFYCTSLVIIIYIHVCIYIVLVIACMEAYSFLHMVTSVHAL